MLVCYSGLPGSGKTAHAARDIRYALAGKRWRPIICNFQLSPNAKVPQEHMSWFHYIANEDLTVESILDVVRGFWSSPDCPFDHIKEDWILLIIDEAQISHNSRTWSNGGRMEFLTFLSQSRHYGVKVIMITQKATMIDKQYRDLIDIDYEHRRLSRMSFVMKPVQWLVGGCLTLVVAKLLQYNERMGMELCRYGMNDFTMYDSYNSISLGEFAQSG